MRPSGIRRAVLAMASALESIQEGWFTVRRSGPHDPTIPFPIDVTHLIGRYDHLLRIVHKT